MTSVFTAHDYRSFVSKRFLLMPKKGYGQARKLSAFLGVHTTLVSQVLKGHKSFTLEQAALVSEFLGLTSIEEQYFLLLVSFDRAGNESLRKILQKQITELKSKSSELATRLQSQKNLTEEKRAVFYSDWIYSAIRQLTAIREYQSPAKISEYLHLPQKRTREVLDFLVSAGLCVEERGVFKIGPSSTHLESDSPWVKSHHINWRVKAIQQLNQEEAAKLHYSCPLTISKADAIKVREQIVQLLESVDKVIEPSSSEELRCLNIDWFKI